MLIRANVDNRNEQVFNRLTDNVLGKIYADKGYISEALFTRLFSNGIHLVKGLRNNMKNRLMPIYDKIILRKRSVIETINDELKNVAQAVHSRHKSVFNFSMNILSALAAYSFFEKKSAINEDFCIEQSNGQLVLFNLVHNIFDGILTCLTVHCQRSFHVNAGKEGETIYLSRIQVPTLLTDAAYNKKLSYSV